MELVSKFLKLYPSLLSVVANNDFVVLLALLFVFLLIINIASYFIWGKY